MILRRQKVRELLSFRGKWLTSGRGVKDTKNVFISGSFQFSQQNNVLMILFLINDNKTVSNWQVVGVLWEI